MDGRAGREPVAQIEGVAGGGANIGIAEHRGDGQQTDAGMSPQIEQG
jgi:hypothetical protein